MFASVDGVSAFACAGASPINQTGQEREDLMSGQVKSLMENLTCYHMRWQGQAGQKLKKQLEIWEQGQW